MLTDRRGRLVVRSGDIVVKAHMADDDPQELLARLRLAADPRLADVLVAPLPIPGAAGGMLARVDGRWVSAWPAGRPLAQAEVDTAPDSAPWEQAAVLLARLHATPLSSPPLPAEPPVPPAGVCRRMARAMARLEEAVARSSERGRTEGRRRRAGRLDGRLLAEDVRRAYLTLPQWLSRTPTRPGGRAALIHGDFHLGQVVRMDQVARMGAAVQAGTADAAGRPGGAEAWRLIDVDDLGVGDPAWDLARPAAWFAAGMLPSGVWERFLDAYRAAGGIAVPADGDPWPVLDGPARAVVVQYAAGAVADLLLSGTPLDDGAVEFLACARRMARLAASEPNPGGTLPA